MPYHLAMAPYDSDGNRTRVTAVKGRCLDRLTTEPHYSGFSPIRSTVFSETLIKCFLGSFNQIRKYLIRFQERPHTRLVYYLAKCFRAPRVGLEPTTSRLTAVRSTIELSRNISFASFRMSFVHSKLHTDSEFHWSSPRSISNSQLHVLPHFHLCPIYLVVFKGSYSLM